VPHNRGMNRSLPVSAFFAVAAVAVVLLGAALSPGPVSKPSARLVAHVAPVVGQAAPDFTLRDQNGARVILSQTLGHKSVLVFYRGYW
jgi:cytochrome oxidase Cu insertion factor (SCO1/SenC/PrrC family)